MAFQSPADLTIKTEKIVLDKYMVGVASRISRDVLKDLVKLHRDQPLRQGTLYTDLSPITDEMLIQMRVFLLKSQHVEQETLSVSTPSTWFDHLKRDWLESGVSWKMWVAGKLEPPKFVTESRTVDKITRVCPHNDSYMMDGRQHLEWLMWKHD